MNLISLLTTREIRNFGLCPCKVNHLLRSKVGLSKFLFKCNFLPLLEEAGFDDGLVTPDSILELSGSTKTSSGSGGYGEVWCRALFYTATTEIVRKKRSIMRAEI
ncbi:putative zinc ion binding protein [Corchorus olitorius]|uniref:Zinc ion binding protein n=1 Tax=Corchorus olitorius TaxID=93759 RepID=A0A1R3KPL3_9ROSI|nr:putative zinc ion binding protein [Corchorus olitorius]